MACVCNQPSPAAKCARFYSNLADSYIYQIRKGIKDADMLEQCRSLIEKHKLDKQWYTGARKISSSQDVFELYHAYLSNNHSGEKVIYQSPLYKRVMEL